MTQSKPVELVRTFTTKSGKPLLLGTGSGTKWKDLKFAKKKEDPSITIVQEVVEPVKLALDSGFYHIDTAEVYSTHPEVAEAIKQAGAKREDLWITTKYSPGFLKFKAQSQNPTEFIDRALEELNTDYIDLFLIHSPFFGDDISFGQTIESAWEHLIAAKKAGKVREIGVSNFAIPHLKKTFKAAGNNPEFYPVVNQIEFHPYLQNQSKGIYKFAQDNRILLEAYGPLTPIFRINKDEKEVADHPLTTLLPQLSAKYGRTEAQILLRYTLQKGILPITTSSNPERVKQSLEIYEFALDDEDIAEIDKAGASFHYRAFFDFYFDDFEFDENDD